MADQYLNAKQYEEYRASLKAKQAAAASKSEPTVSTIVGEIPQSQIFMGPTAVAPPSQSSTGGADYEVPTPVTGVPTTFSKTRDLIHDIIGLPPIYFKQPELLERLLVSAMPVMAIFPAMPKFGSGQEGTPGIELYTLNYIEGINQYNDIINSLGVKGIDPLKGNCLYVAFLNDTTLTESFGVEMGESKFEAIGNQASSTLTELRYMTGTSDVKSAMNKIGASAGILKPAFDVAGSIAGLGTDALNGLMSGLGQILSGSKIDFPLIWKGASYVPSYSMTVRLWNWAVNSEEDFIQNIVSPIARLLALVMPVSDSASTYAFPVLCTIVAPGMFKIKTGFVSSIEIIKGGEANDISWMQRVGSVDVRITINEMYKTMIADTNSIKAKRTGATASPPVLDKQRPLINDYIDNLISKTTIENIYYSELPKTTQQELGVKVVSKPQTSKTSNASLNPIPRLTDSDKSIGQTLDQAATGDPIVNAQQTDVDNCWYMDDKANKWNDDLYTMNSDPSSNLNSMDSSFASSSSNYGTYADDLDNYNTDSATNLASTQSAYSDLHSRDIDWDTNDPNTYPDPAELESALGDHDNVFLGMANTTETENTSFSNMTLNIDKDNQMSVVANDNVSNYSNTYNQVSNDQDLGRLFTAANVNRARYESEETAFANSNYTNLSPAAVDTRMSMFDDLSGSFGHLGSSFSNLQSSISAGINPLGSVIQSVNTMQNTSRAMLAPLYSMQQNVTSTIGSVAMIDSALSSITGKASTNPSRYYNVINKINTMTSPLGGFGGYSGAINSQMGALNTVNFSLNNIIGNTTALGNTATGGRIAATTAAPIASGYSTNAYDIQTSSNNLRARYNQDKTIQAYQNQYNSGAYTAPPADNLMSAEEASYVPPPAPPISPFDNSGSMFS